MLTLSGGHALVLGGGSVLAQCVATRLLAMGTQVTLTVRTPEQCPEVLETLCAGGAPGTCAAVRVLPLALETARVGCEQLVSVLASDVPGYLVDCLHPGLEGYVAAMDPDVAEAYFAAAIGARHRILQAVTRLMLSARRKAATRLVGRLLFVSSAAAGMPGAGQGYYAAVKVAAEALYRSVGLELAGRGITTVSLRPGFVAAGRGERYLSEHPEVLRTVPLGRAITADEVASAILWLLSDQAVAVNATTITMDGGMSAGKQELPCNP